MSAAARRALHREFRVVLYFLVAAVLAELALHGLDVAHDHGEQIVEVVRKPAGQAAHRLHFRRLAQLLLGAGALLDFRTQAFLDDRAFVISSRSFSFAAAISAVRVATISVMSVACRTNARFAVVVQHRERAGKKPVIHAVLAAKTILDLVRLAGAERMLPGFPRALVVLGMQQFFPVFARRRAREFDTLLVVEIERAVGPVRPYQLRHGVGDDAEFALARRKRPLRLFQFGDVEQRDTDDFDFAALVAHREEPREPGLQVFRVASRLAHQFETGNGLSAFEDLPDRFLYRSRIERRVLLDRAADDVFLTNPENIREFGIRLRIVVFAVDKAVADRRVREHGVERAEELLPLAGQQLLRVLGAAAADHRVPERGGRKRHQRAIHDEDADREQIGHLCHRRMSRMPRNR